MNTFASFEFTAYIGIDWSDTKHGPFVNSSAIAMRPPKRWCIEYAHCSMSWGR